jgi:hypothetical protein
MLGVTSGIDPKLITKDYGGKKIKIKAMAMMKSKKSSKESDSKKKLFSKENKLPFMVKIKMAAAMNKKSKKC